MRKSLLRLLVLSLLLGFTASCGSNVDLSSILGGDDQSTTSVTDPTSVDTTIDNTSVAPTTTDPLKGVIPIATVRSNVPTTHNVVSGSSYRTAGVVTNIEGNSFYIQDDTAAIYVYGGSTNFGIAVGDYVKVEGYIKHYNNLIEFVNGATTPLSVDKLDIAAPTITALDITEMNFTAAALADKDSLLVTIDELRYVSGTVVTDGSAASTITFTNANSESVSVFISKYLSTDILTALSTSLTDLTGKVVKLTSVNLSWGSSGPSIALTDAARVGSRADDNPPPPVETTIAAARAAMPATQGEYSSTLHTARGVVTMKLGKSFYIQDENAAIYVYVSNSNTTITANVGDYVQVVGNVQNYYGLAEMAVPNYGTVEVSMVDGVAPEITSMDLTDMDFDAATLAGHDSKRVSINGLFYSSGTFVPNDYSTIIFKNAKDQDVPLSINKYISDIPAIAAIIEGMIPTDTIDLTDVNLDWNESGPRLTIDLASKITFHEGAEVPVTDITITNTEPLSLKVNETIQLDATVAPADATVKTVTWTSKDPAVVTVTSTGLVRGIAIGTAKLEAKASDFTKEFDISVTAGDDISYTYALTHDFDFSKESQDTGYGTKTRSITNQADEGKGKVDFFSLGGQLYTNSHATASMSFMLNSGNSAVTDTTHKTAYVRIDLGENADIGKFEATVGIYNASADESNAGKATFEVLTADEPGEVDSGVWTVRGVFTNEVKLAIDTNANVSATFVPSRYVMIRSVNVSVSSSTNARICMTSLKLSKATVAEA